MATTLVTAYWGSIQLGETHSYLVYLLFQLVWLRLSESLISRT